jgi:ribosomal protein S18 acetylase RimI-like enzyme
VKEPLEVRRAGPEDVEEIVAILSECARWLLARGIEQWPDPFPRERVAALTARGELYLARLGREPVATVALLWSDPTFWGERPPDAGYVHALAVRRAQAGRGLGARLLEWAEREVAAAGREFLRLDCRTENAVLRRYYEALGFERRGEVAVDDFVSTLYERRCRPHRPGAPRRVEESARFRPGSVADTRAPRRYARSGSEGGPPTPPKREGVPLQTGRPAGLAAPEWRAFWRERGMRELRLLLSTAWEPARAAPAGALEADPSEDARAAREVGVWFDGAHA